MRKVVISDEMIKEYDENCAYYEKMFDLMLECKDVNDVLMINRCKLEMENTQLELNEMLNYIMDLAREV